MPIILGGFAANLLQGQGWRSLEKSILSPRSTRSRRSEASRSSAQCLRGKVPTSASATPRSPSREPIVEYLEDAYPAVPL
jgi:hypothetical protein